MTKLLMVTILGCALTAPVHAQTPHDLASFGPIATADEAAQTFERAVKSLQASSGGVILIPVDAPHDWQPANVYQEMLRDPPPPAPSNLGWSVGPGVTVVDARQARLIVPSVTGLRLRRTFDLQPMDSSPHWQYHPALQISSTLVSGPSHYGGRLHEAVTAGPDRRFQVTTLQGLRPGQLLEVQGSKFRIQVKSLGYDQEKQQAYFVADADADFPAGAMLGRSDVLSAVRTTTHANNELQTFDVFARRWHYSQGDAYGFYGRLRYMGNESAASPQPEPDAEGVLRGSTAVIAGTIRSLTNVFRGRVETADPVHGQVTYADAVNAHTLATGRPLINLNPDKWVTAGHAYLMQPGGAMLNWGGSLRSTDAPWSAQLVGRYFAIDEPSEYVTAPGDHPVRRWYVITGFNEKDGIKYLGVRRYWWGAKNSGVGISQIYDGSNWSGSDENPKLLRYIVAPGSYVYDVAESVGARRLRLTPYRDRGSASDFAAGDPIEQAIGPDPFNPIPFRAWFFDKVPSAYPSAAFELANMGSVTRSAAIAFGGSGYMGSLLWIEPGAKVGDVLEVIGDADSVFMFRQKHGNRQTISWNDGPMTRTLGVDPARGTFSYNGEVDLAGQSVTGVSSLAGPHAAPRDADRRGSFRGRDVAVTVGTSSMDVLLPAAEPDEHYAVILQTTWLTDRAIIAQTATGFTVTFSTPAPAGARLHWLLVR